MTSIVLSARAAARVRQLLDDVGADERYGLRISVELYGWTHRYRLSLAPAPAENEVVVPLGDLEVFVHPASAALIDGVRIDYLETATSAGFTFHQSQPPAPGAPPRSRRPAGSRPTAGRPEHVDAELWRRVETALDGIRPYLWRDGGDATVVAIDGSTVELMLEGACSGCAAALATVTGVIERRLTAAVNEITRVVVVS